MLEKMVIVQKLKFDKNKYINEWNFVEKGIK